MPKFAVGDRVTIVKGRGWQGTKPGRIARYKSTSSDGVEWYNVEYDGEPGSRYLWTSDELIPEFEETELIKTKRRLAKNEMEV